MKKYALVTGASSGFGEAISRMLCEEGYEVFCFGRDFSKSANEMTGCHRLEGDLLDTSWLLEQAKEIRSRCKISFLVNNAGVGYYGLHEELNPKKIQEMVRTNLEVPMILTQCFLRDLKQQRGWVINVSSITAGKTNPHGCAYGATKAGLSGFSASLFEEARKYGVRVLDLKPDLAKTNLYRNADFCEGEEEESYLLPEEVAETIRFALGRREGATVTSLSLRPQLHRIRRKEKNSAEKSEG